MKKIIIEETQKVINLNSVDLGRPIFVKEKGKLIGMVIKEMVTYKGGKKEYIVNIGGDKGSYGYFNNVEDLIKTGMNNYNYEFFVN